jgi:hypothetical protein
MKYEKESRIQEPEAGMETGERRLGFFLSSGPMGTNFSSRPFPPVPLALRVLREGLSFSGKSLRGPIYLSPLSCGQCSPKGDGWLLIADPSTAINKLDRL